MPNNNNSPQFPRTIPPSSVFDSKNAGPPGGLQSFTPQQMQVLSSQLGHPYMQGHPHASLPQVVNMHSQYGGLSGLSLMGGMNIGMPGGQQPHNVYSPNPLSLSGGPNYALPPNANASINTPSPSSSPGSVKRSRKNLEKNQVEVLENAFAAERYPSKQAKELIAAQSGLDYSKVVKWFDNRRTKARKTSETGSGSPYVGESPVNSPAPPPHNMNMPMSNNSPSSPDGSPAGHRSPSLYTSNSFPQGPTAYHHPNVNPNYNRGAPQGAVNTISQKMNNLAFSGNMDEEAARKIKSEMNSSVSDGDFNIRFDRKNNRSKEESWEDCKEHRIYASEIGHGRSAAEIKEGVYGGVEGYLSDAIEKKKSRMDTYQHMSNVDHFGGFRREIYSLLESTEFHGETEIQQGDQMMLSGSTTVNDITIRRGPNPGENDPTRRVEEKNVVHLELLSESRTSVSRQVPVHNCIRRVVIKVTNHVPHGGKYGEKPETFTIGLKAWGSTDLMNNCETWGNIERLQQILDTSLKQTELLSFLFFCFQFRTSQRTCMRQSMFNDEDTDYYSENEE
ncbi:homeobox protein aristaless-like 3-like [Planoprotostelium fungivorum]|uniref:Homeobox protein aristaless-like 3-like n=1 Tax=Planoprotostelium fungivorum TaxID=1890364 RepID=A0A2P6NZ71_9EUKA|nr:homeobox protein aristaless-like 3-like [Planoprotostelium fungivorum]